MTGREIRRWITAVRDDPRRDGNPTVLLVMWCFASYAMERASVSREMVADATGATFGEIADVTLWAVQSGYVVVSGDDFLLTLPQPPVAAREGRA